MKNLNWFFIGLLLNLNLNRPAEDQEADRESENERERERVESVADVEAVKVSALRKHMS